MTNNSHNAWNTIRKLSNDPTTSNPPCLVSANQVEKQLLINSRSAIQPETYTATPSNRRYLNQRRRVHERSVRTKQQHGYCQSCSFGGATKESRFQSPQVFAEQILMGKLYQYYGYSPRSMPYLSLGRLRFPRVAYQYSSYVTRRNSTKE